MPAVTSAKRSTFSTAIDATDFSAVVETFSATDPAALFKTFGSVECVRYFFANCIFAFAIVPSEPPPCYLPDPASVVTAGISSAQRRPVCASLGWPNFIAQCSNDRLAELCAVYVSVCAALRVPDVLGSVSSTERSSHSCTHGRPKRSSIVATDFFSGSSHTDSYDG